MLSLLLLLPFQGVIRRLWPVYFLPDTIVLKKHKPDWDHYYRREQDTYKKLEPLQGRVVPIYYGEGWCGETRVLVLFDVGGVMACEQTMPRMGLGEFRRRLRVAIEELGHFCMVQDDMKLDNVILVQDRIVFVDLEMVYEVRNDPEWLEEHPNWLEERMDGCLEGFNDEYVRYLRTPWFRS